MKIGVPREIKPQEYRVGLTPDYVHELTALGHEVVVEQGAGAHIGFDDRHYREAGAQIVLAPEQAYDASLIIKVKEPQLSEVPMMSRGQLLFTYLHLAASLELTQQLLKSGVTAIAYETVSDGVGRLPLLIPMSIVAGRLAAQAGAHALQMTNGGRGILPGGVPGVPPARVAVVGGGIVGIQASRVAKGMGADVTILDIDSRRLQQLDDSDGPFLKTCQSTPQELQRVCTESDLLIVAALKPGYRSPVVINRAMIQSMTPGSVVVDVAIDQGGCVETSRPTTHDSPTFVAHGVVHYCVTNMPSACARTATLALTHATWPYIRDLVRAGGVDVLRQDAGFAEGLTVYRGTLTNRGVAETHHLDWCPPAEAISGL